MAHNDLLRRDDFTRGDSWRVFRIMAEFVEGFETLSRLKPAIAIFGSSRATEEDPYYQKAEEIAYLLGKEGYAIITGGGPGIMEAANRGARRARSLSVGLCIQLPEEKPNPYVEMSIEFRYFFVRKVMFVKYSNGFIFLPGGLGTLDEFFEINMLIQTGKIDPVPIVLVGSDYWKGLIQWLHERPLTEGKISSEDLGLFVIRDEAEEVVRYITEWNGKLPEKPETSLLSSPKLATEK